MHKLSSNFYRCYPTWHRVNLFPSLTQENQGSPVQWVLNTASHSPVRNWVQGPPPEKKQPQSQLMGWFFSEPSPPLEEEGNLRLNVTVVTVAAWHRSQWNSTVSIQPSPCAGTYQVLSCPFSSPQPSHTVPPLLLPAKPSLVLLSAPNSQIHSHTYTHTYYQHLHSWPVFPILSSPRDASCPQPRGRHRCTEADSVQGCMLQPTHAPCFQAILPGHLHLRGQLWVRTMCQTRMQNSFASDKEGSGSHST